MSRLRSVLLPNFDSTSIPHGRAACHFPTSVDAAWLRKMKEMASRLGESSIDLLRAFRNDFYEPLLITNQQQLYVRQCALYNVFNVIDEKVVTPLV